MKILIFIFAAATVSSAQYYYTPSSSYYRYRWPYYNARSRSYNPYTRPSRGPPPTYVYNYEPVDDDSYSPVPVYRSSYYPVNPNSRRGYSRGKFYEKYIPDHPEDVAERNYKPIFESRNNAGPYSLFGDRSFFSGYFDGLDRPHKDNYKSRPSTWNSYFSRRRSTNFNPYPSAGYKRVERKPKLQEAPYVARSPFYYYKQSPYYY